MAFDDNFQEPSIDQGFQAPRGGGAAGVAMPAVQGMTPAAGTMPTPMAPPKDQNEGGGVMNAAAKVQQSPGGQASSNSGASLGDPGEASGSM